MPLDNGLDLREDFDHRMIRFRNAIEEKAGLVKELAKKIRLTEETLENLRKDGLVSDELEKTFSQAARDYLEDKQSAEKEIAGKLEEACQEINRAKEICDHEIDGVKNTAGSHAAQVLSSLLKRKAEIGQWEEELREKANTADV